MTRVVGYRAVLKWRLSDPEAKNPLLSIGETLHFVQVGDVLNSPIPGVIQQSIAKILPDAFEVFGSVAHFL